MAIDNPAGYLQNAGTTHTAEQMRTYIGAQMAGKSGSGGVMITRNGVVPHLGTAMVVTQNGTPNMSVNVGAGVAFIAGSEGATQGIYTVRAGTVTNLSIAAAPGAGLNRIDLVVAKVQDSAYSGATDAWSLAVVTGTAASSPAAPAAPANSLTLGQVFVGALVSSIVTGNITDARPFSAASGGNIPCNSTGRPAALYDGLTVFEYDTNLFSWTDGSTWFPQSNWVQGQNIWAIPTTTNNFANTTYANFTLNAVVQSVSMTKRYASTRLKINFGGTGRVSAVSTVVGVAALIAGTDYDIHRAVVTVAVGHFHLGGTRFVSGVSAGAITPTVRVKVDANTFTSDSNDIFTFTCEEVQ